MSKKTLGQVVKQRREALALTQRQLAARLGVKSSHIAYIENGNRNPSLALLKRVSNVLDLDSREILLLAYPEARYLLRPSQSNESNAGADAWREFSKNRPLLKRWGVTPGELKILEQVSLFRRVGRPRDFLFILNSIRQAAEEDSEL